VNWLVFVSAVLGAYLLGAIPFGFIAGKLKGIDIRTTGSGNIGATNVGRALGRKSMLIVFALDVLKGYGPTLAAKMWLSRLVVGEAGPAWAGQTLTMCVAAATILGHMFPVYLRFRGGKGVATGLGLLLAISLPTALAALGTWTVVLGLWGYVSLASIAAAVSYPLWFAVMARVSGQPLEGQALVWGFTTVLCAFVIWRHRGNVARILKGTEPKIGRRNARVQSPESEAEGGRV
jgi:glycerol-3-phosphate acyltransferase PlsY